MSSDFFRACCLATLLPAVVVAAPPAADPSADEAAIRSSIRAYVEAFDRADARALAALWSETGHWVSDRVQLRGRAEIEAALTANFAAGPRATLEIVAPQIRFVAADVAVEDGTARVIAADGAVEESTYTALHVRRDGRWQLENVRETTAAPAAPSGGPLAALAWMVGEWVDQSPDSTIETKVEWSQNEKFLLCHFRATFAGMPPLSGTQVIGYDAAADSIRSWLFDADGTIGEGRWTSDGGRWIVRSTQTLADGRRASSTNVYEPGDADRYVWKSTDRKVGEHVLPDLEAVVVVRRSKALAQNKAEKPVAGDRP